MGIDRYEVSCRRRDPVTGSRYQDRSEAAFVTLNRYQERSGTGAVVGAGSATLQGRSFGAVLEQFWGSFGAVLGQFRPGG